MAVEHLKEAVRQALPQWLREDPAIRQVLREALIEALRPWEEVLSELRDFRVVAPLSSARWYHRSQIPTEVGPMNRKPHSQNPPCPRCGATHVIKNGSKGGRPRWVCRNCGRSFGPTLGTAMYRLRATPTEVARTLLVVMRRGSLSAAEEITGHQVETIRRWRRAAARHAEALTEVLVHDLHLSEVEVDAFWSFVKKSVRRLEIQTPRRAGWARVGDV
jgi:transposase-like protein